jgi:chemotaxis protein CheC
MFTESQLASLTALFQRGAEDASDALTRWLNRPARVSVNQVEQIPLSSASGALGDPEKPVCCSIMGLTGRVTGQLILASDDASGLALADLLLGRNVGTSTAWTDYERSAALETANIVGCAYLNALFRCFSTSDSDEQELLPSPPRFIRDFADSVLQFALMDQAAHSDVVLLTRTEFHIEHSPVDCCLLLIPESRSLEALRDALPSTT